MMRNIGALALLLALLVGYGAWNFQRNVEAEAKEVRPYRSYSDADLEQLLDAYEDQADRAGARYDRVAKRRSGGRDAQLLGDAVNEFERVQSQSRAIRELGERASQEMASVKAIQAERSLRARRGTGWMRLLKMAFVPPAT